MGARQRTPHLIGRERPIGQLFDALADVNESGALVLLGGEAGIGKTRLLDEFASRAEDALVARGGCIEGVAYAPWTDALWWLLTSTDSVTPDDLPPGVRSQLARLIPQLGGTETIAQESNDGGQHLLFAAVVELLAQFAAAQTLVLVIDDVHWIDPASRELLRYVAGNLRRAPILLVAAYRPEDSIAELELLAQLGRLGGHRIALEGLPDDATTEMVTYLLGDEATPADVERITRDADGNPLFVEELVAARDEEAAPQTLRDLMRVRFNALDDDARHLVRTAALIGPRLPRAWLVPASGLDDDRATKAARAAADTGVLLADEDARAYAFRHALLRQAVLDDLLPDERLPLHRAIAGALTDHPERAVGVDRVAELARHWDAADDAKYALHWQVAAAQQAEVRYAFEAAFAAYERALFWWELVDDPAAVIDLDHVALLLAAADAAGVAGHIERAADLGRASFDEACAIDPGRGVEAAGRVYPLFWAADRAPELFEIASSTLLPVLDRVEPNTRGRFLVSAVEHLMRHKTPSETRDAAVRMMDTIREVDNPALEARAHMVMAGCCELFGDFDPVETEYERAAQIARGAQAHSVLALILYNHAAFLTSVPDLARCGNYLDEVDSLVERFGLRHYLVPAHCLRALATCLLGDLTSASAAVAAVEDLFLEGFDAWFRATVGALINLFAGDYDAIGAGLEPDAVGAAEPRDSEHVINVSMLRADALAWAGDIDGARKAADEGAAAVDRYCETYWHGWLAMVALRVEADAAVAATASQQLDAIEHAQRRADAIAARWQGAVAQLEAEYPLVRAYSCAIDAEMARLKSEGLALRARAAAEAFAAISMPYYATYFRWRAGQAELEAGYQPRAPNSSSTRAAPPTRTASQASTPPSPRLRAPTSFVSARPAPQSTATSRCRYASSRCCV